jgi:hypothetical protein
MCIIFLAFNMYIRVYRHMFERRLGLFPVYFTGDNQIVTNTLWADRPFRIPQERMDFSKDDLSMGWHVLSYNKVCE